MPLKSNSIALEVFFSEENLVRIFEEKLSDVKYSGLDGVNVSQFSDRIESEVQIISDKVRSESYQFTRYKEKLILKKFNKPPRQIAIPTIRDALTLRALCDFLGSQLEGCKMQPPHDVTKQVAEAVEASPPGRCFLRMDVENFFPSIGHNILIENLNSQLNDDAAVSLVESAIKTQIGFDSPVHSSNGVPQGLSISNILSMLYLKEFDSYFRSKYAFFRYVDDILIIDDCCNVKKIHTEVSDFLKTKLELSSHPLRRTGNGKTEISRLAVGTDYLGYSVSKSLGNSKCLISIREGSYKKMFRAIVGCLRTLKGNTTAEQALWRLNLVISGCKFEGRSVGWVLFFRQSNNIKQFHRMDHFVKQQMSAYGIGHLNSRVKTFVKSYREIRYNRSNTKYIPDFDNFSMEDMIEVITLIGGYSERRVLEMGDTRIEEVFWSIVKRQVAKLERETIDFGRGSGSP